jgi:hypothetical protein
MNARAAPPRAGGRKGAVRDKGKQNEVALLTKPPVPWATYIELVDALSADSPNPPPLQGTWRRYALEQTVIAYTARAASAT